MFLNYRRNKFCDQTDRQADTCADGGLTYSPLRLTGRKLKTTGQLGLRYNFYPVYCMCSLSHKNSFTLLTIQHVKDLS